MSSGKRQLFLPHAAKSLHKPLASFTPLRATIIRSLRPLHKLY